MSPMIDIRGTRFVDAAGRHVILRGVNFGGDCKVPFMPDGHSYRPTDFADHRTVSFVGRPAPLDEIDGHLARIAGWGFNCLRLLTTWEAVEHAGPGVYDEAYLDYFAEVCRRAASFGLFVFIDFHQDVWARMSGGDGAPGWTFQVAGLDFTRFDAADAAHVMQYRYDARAGGRQSGYPPMSWGANYRMPANGIMWTLFFAGDVFTPGLRIDGTDVRAWLQTHYLGSMRALAERVASIDHVIGFDTLNEPGSGWIGQRLSERRGLLRGAAWTPLDGLAAASGHPRTLPLLEGGEICVNPTGISIWRDGHGDPFRAAGAWDVDAAGTPVALDDDFFTKRAGVAIDHDRDFMQPFYQRVADTIRSVRPDWLIFAEADPFRALTGEGFPAAMPPRTVNASHWYDLAALVHKRFDIEDHVDLGRRKLAGRDAIRAAYRAQLERLAGVGARLNGGSPTLIGECGIPFDMNGAAVYAAWAAGARAPDIWSAQTAALALMYDVFDELLLSSTQWNYTVSNRNDAMVGDGWNQEDLSIWSVDQVDAAAGSAGGRAVAGFCRPHCKAAKGTIVRVSWDSEARRFECLVDVDLSIDQPTEIYLPPDLEIAKMTFWNGTCLKATQTSSLLLIDHNSNGRARIVIELTPL